MANNQPPYDLSILAQNREQLLLAEMAAWLHDVGKCTDVQIFDHSTQQNQRWGNRGSYKVVVDDPRSILRTSLSQSEVQRRLGTRLKQILSNTHPTFFSVLKNRFLSKALEWEKFITSSEVDYPGGASFSLAELIMLSPPSVAKPSEILHVFGKDGWLPAALGIAHGVAHFDKQHADGAKQHIPVRGATAFGFEQKVENLTSQLKSLPTSAKREQIVEFANKTFKLALGDTTRPVNEITLLDWAWTVAALYKSTVAKESIGTHQEINNRDDNDLCWRLLGCRVDGLGYMLAASGIPDILSRKELLENGWNNVRNLLEEEYPLGLEVYRDENGSIYVVPDIDKLELVSADLSRSDKPALRQLIQDAFAAGTLENDDCLKIGKEVIPDIVLDEKGWTANNQDIPPVWRHLQAVPTLSSDPTYIRDFWCKSTADICTVCGLRPQGPGRKSVERNVCDICERRRDDRARKWAADLGSNTMTIWTDEVADKNGRLALLVGFFDLTHWLSGDLVRTLAVRAPDDKHTSAEVSKNPSFARLRRIWETTRQFWKEIAPQKNKDLKGCSLVEEVIATDSIRKKRLTISGKVDAKSLGPYHSYELVIEGKGVPVLWDPERYAFITTVNLEWLEKELIGKEEGEDKKDLIQYLRELNENGASEWNIRTPGSYGEESQEIGSLPIENVEGGIIFMDGEYLPIVPILTEPGTFMLLLPAEDAMNLVQAIRKKYEREMGKVRNRLPLHLSLIFAHKRTPLRALFDAGRQALGRQGNASGWRVIKAEDNLLPDFLQNDPHFKTSKRIVLDRNGRKVTWCVPLTMGDGQTEDVWYPYLFVQNIEQPKGKSLWFELTDDQWKNPWNEQHKYLVHAGEVQQEEKVYFTPSTFDFEFLDVTSRRFEMYYDNYGQRASIKRRPYLLDELDEWGQMVSHLNHLEQHQVYQIVQVLEATRDLWGVGYPDKPEEETVFSQFVEDTLANAAWSKSHQWMSISEEERNLLVKAGVNGTLKDIVELYFQILKTKFNEQPVKSS